jgi:ComF family protein
VKPVAAHRRAWRELLHRLGSFALPQVCALCASGRTERLVCDDCAAALPRNVDACPSCALPLGTSGRCGHCLMHPPAFDRSHAAFVYAFPVDRLVQAYKYQGLLACAGWFAEAMLAERQAPPLADLLVAVPLARGRQRERGFNQSLEIARALGRRTGLQLAVDALVRIRETPPQADLPWRERAQNIRGAFACTAAVACRRIAVVDDVMTTGASLDEIAKVLKRAGAASVENWLVARTPAPGDRDFARSA